LRFFALRIALSRLDDWFDNIQDVLAFRWKGGSAPAQFDEGTFGRGDEGKGGGGSGEGNSGGYKVVGNSSKNGITAPVPNPFGNR
jgi:hypothetical protein